MSLVTVKDRVSSNLKLIFSNKSVIKTSKKINDQKMRELADHLKAEIPGCGFALIALDIQNNETCANYVSNVDDDFMIKALEVQLNILKNKKAASISGALKS